MKLLTIIWNWLSWIWHSIFPRRDPLHKVQIVEADTPPDEILGRDFVLAREDGEDWAIAFLCPCGCNDRLELALIPEVKPNWTLSIDNENYPTLNPSVWRKTGCKAHFWVKAGKLIWCK